jgi:predicted DNA-binding transcriptional regulator YafY
VRASRLVALLFTLQRLRSATAAELARELEVSERTIYRDVSALTAAGVPLWTEPGRGGGIRLIDGWRTRLDGLTGQETAAIFAAGVPQVLADLGLGAALAGAQAKLLATLPDGLREHAGAVAERFHLDAPGWFRTPRQATQLAAVAEAVWEQRRLRVSYRRGGHADSRDSATVERVLDPLGLVLKAGTWYLVAVPAPRDGRGPRTYRVSRVHSAAVRDEPVERPADFDLESFWADYQRGYERRVYRESALVRLSQTGRELLFLVGTIPARSARAAMSAPDDSGWTTTRIPIESVRHGHHALMQLGEHVEVLEPAELRELMGWGTRHALPKQLAFLGRRVADLVRLNTRRGDGPRHLRAY